MRTSVIRLDDQLEDLNSSPGEQEETWKNHTFVTRLPRFKQLFLADHTEFAMYFSKKWC